MIMLNINYTLLLSYLTSILFSRLGGIPVEKTPDPRTTFSFATVLVSAGIELTVFLVAGTVLCFDFSM